MQITKSDFQKIMEYVRDALVDQLGLDGKITKPIIVGTLQDVTLEDVLNSLGEKKEKKKTVVFEDNGFESFWKEYPASDNFSYKGMKFTGSRTLRSNKAIAYSLYCKMLSELKITKEEALEALTRHIDALKRESWESGNNKLTYLSEIQVYLRQGKIEPWLEIEKEQQYSNTNFL